MNDNAPEPADGIAFIRAHLTEDLEKINQILGMVDERELFAVVVGQLVRMLHNAGVSAELLDHTLSQWQADQLL